MNFKSKDISSAGKQWQVLNSIEQLQAVIDASNERPIGIFKHSTRCSISSMAKSRIETAMSDSTPDLYLLDLLSHRDVSNAIEEQFDIQHESPQLILLHMGKPLYNASHGMINMKDLLKYTTS